MRRLKASVWSGLTAIVSLTFLVMLLVILSGCASADQAPDARSLDAVFAAEGVDPATATIIVRRLEDGREWRVNRARADQRFRPASTSKIPHSLIALETGVVSGPAQKFEWDGTRRWAKGWNESQNFRTAFQRSTVWIYQDVTPRIGAEALKHWLNVFGYGNADIGGPDNITNYWLGGPLEISATEQVAFLARLANQDLPLSEATYADALMMMQVDYGEGWRLYAKTGWKHVPDEQDYGWYVGWLVQDEGAKAGTYVFAFNMDFADSREDAPKRVSTVRRSLREIGALSQ